MSNGLEDIKKGDEVKGENGELIDKLAMFQPFSAHAWKTKRK